MTDLFASRKPYNHPERITKLPLVQRQPSLWGDLRGARLRELVVELGIAAEQQCDRRPFAAKFNELLAARREGATGDEALRLAALAVFLGQRSPQLAAFREHLVDAFHRSSEPTA